MSPVVAVSLAMMAAADVVTFLRLGVLGVARLRLIRHVQRILLGLDPDTQPIQREVRSLVQRLRTVAGLARDGAQHARTGVSHLGVAAGNVRTLVAPPTVPRWGLAPGAGDRAAQN